MTQNSQKSDSNAPNTSGVLAVEYQLDAKDRITALNEEWNRFATGNGGEQMQAENLIGRSLHDFISGDVTKMFVNAMLQSTRLTGKARTIQYRCDSPQMKRYMAMEIAPLGQNGLVSRHWTIQEVKLPSAISLMTAPRPDGIRIKRCSMCNRLSRNGGPVVEPEVASASGWFGEGLTQVIYFVCQDCQSAIKNKWGT